MRKMILSILAEAVGFEPTTSSLTGSRSSDLSYTSLLVAERRLELLNARDMNPPSYQLDYSAKLK